MGFAADDRYRLHKELTYCDSYHSANRYGTGHQSVPIVLPRSTLWSFSRQRLVLGRESMSLQGLSWNAEDLDELNVPETHLQNLAGNSLLGMSQVIVSVTLMFCRLID